MADFPRNAAPSAAAPSRPAAAAEVASDVSLPRTVSRPPLLRGGSDREFRRFVHRLLAFSARLETVRSRFGAQIGLTGIQYTALISVAHLSRDGEIGVKQIADHLGLSGSFATLVIGQLVRLGLVDKGPHPADRRRVQLTVPAKGLALLRQLAPVQRQVNDVMFAPLDGEKFRALNQILTDLLRSGDAAVELVRYLTSRVGDPSDDTAPVSRSAR